MQQIIYRKLTYDELSKAITQIYLADIITTHYSLESTIRFDMALRSSEGIAEYLSIYPYDYVAFEGEIYKVFWANEIQFRSDHNRTFLKNIEPNGHFAKIIKEKTNLPLSDFILVLCV